MRDEAPLMEVRSIVRRFNNLIRKTVTGER
jgi:hypothetical protein